MNIVNNIYVWFNCCFYFFSHKLIYNSVIMVFGSVSLTVYTVLNAFNFVFFSMFFMKRITTAHTHTHKHTVMPWCVVVVVDVESKQETRKQNRFTMECRYCCCAVVASSINAFNNKEKKQNKMYTLTIYKSCVVHNALLPSSNCFWEITLGARERANTKWNENKLHHRSKLHNIYFCFCFFSFHYKSREL